MLRRLRRLGRDTGGVAMIEFAIAAPVMLVMYMGGFVISDMISVNRKVTIADRALTDMVSRNISPSLGTTQATIQSYLTAAELVMTPYSTANTTMQITELRVCDATHAYVVWNYRTGTGTSPASVTAGTVVPIPANLVTSPMVPTSTGGSSDVCNNTTAGTNVTVVGTAGGYLYLGQTTYNYQNHFIYGSTNATPMSDAIYMSPRLT